MEGQENVAHLQAAYTKTHTRTHTRTDTINREWCSQLKISEDKQLQRETRALEIRRGTTMIVAFSDLTAQSHVTDEPQLAFHLDIHVRHKETMFVQLEIQFLCSTPR